MRARLRIGTGEDLRTVEANIGESLAEALKRDPLVGPGFDAPCGGRGLCGKCRVKARGALSPLHPEESALLSAAELSEGFRLACLASIEGDLVVEPRESARAEIVSEGPHAVADLDPPVRRIRVALPPPLLSRQVSDEARLLEALAGAFPAGSGPRRVATAALPGLARAARGELVDAAVFEDQVVSVRSAESPAPRAAVPGAASSGAARPGFGLGVDIGTTTVVAYLVDLGTGAVRGAESALNPQRSHGADVISRIAACESDPAALAELSARVRRLIAELAAALLRRHGTPDDVEAADLLSVAIAGNSTMLHILAGADPGAISRSPFPPVFLSRVTTSTRELSIPLPGDRPVFLAPGVSAYVGGDIVSGIAALGMAEREGPSLLLDIGTNGEIALGDAAGLWCCATAAGPAFEGAGLSMGMGGVSGAVDSAWLDGDRLGYTTIGGTSPRGLCGSGVLDALAAFLEAGLVDSTGRIVDPDEAEGLGSGLAALREEGPGGPRLRVADGVHLSQADIRSLQLAIGAMAAGVDVLMREAGLSPSDIRTVYLAGGFGSRLDLASAARTGLIPHELADRVVVAGNTAGAGAVHAVLSRARLGAWEKAAALCRYVELSSLPAFSEAFMERMIFPEPR